MNKAQKLALESRFNVQIKEIKEWTWKFHRCKWCSYTTRSLQIHHSHMKQHMTRSKNHRFTCDEHTPEKYKCEKCQFQSDFKIFLTEHFDTVHRAKETRHYPTLVIRCCENCDFDTLSLLVFLSHHKSCDGRGVETKNKDSIECVVKEEKHSNQSHQTSLKKDGFFHCSCEHCSYKTNDKHHLQRHMNAKHSQSGDVEKLRRFECDKCPYKAMKGSHMKRHMFWNHTAPEKINWFKCEVCSYKAKSKKLLLVHVQKQHS